MEVNCNKILTYLIPYTLSFQLILYFYGNDYVMKEMMQRVQSFVTFELPIEKNYISEQFTHIHTSKQENYTHWSTAATYQKVIANYWFNDVIRHFILLLGIAVLPTLLFHPVFISSELLAVLSGGIFYFVVMYFFIYRPCFCISFLPHLETIRETYERRQTEQFEKCKQAQLSNFALVLIHFVFTSTSQVPSLPCNDRTAGLLTKLYGVDAGSMKKEFRTYSCGKQTETLNRRKRTELKNRFNEAYDFLEQIGFPQGVTRLKELEMKFFTL